MMDDNYDVVIIFLVMWNVMICFNGLKMVKKWLNVIV